MTIRLARQPIYEHRCDVCQFSVENFSPGDDGRAAPLLLFGPTSRGGRPVCREFNVCRECAHRPLIAILELVQEQASEVEKLLLWEQEEEVPF